MPEAPRIDVSVVFVEADRVFEVALRLPAGATVGEALDASRIRETRPDIEVRADRIGIFSRRATFETPLCDGDRVEIYRPLRIDPKEGRRARAKIQSASERE